MPQLLPRFLALKLLAVVLAAGGAARPALAKCGGSGLAVWPRGNTVRATSVFVVDGYSASQAIIRGLGTTYQIYLQADGQQIPLVVQQVLTGEYAVSQAVLKPRRALEVGRQYELVITETRKKGSARHNLVFQLHRRRVLYTVVPGPDQTPPAWQAQPIETSKQYTEYGCGPAAFVEFTCPVRDDSEYLVQATVTSLSSGKQTSYYVVPGEHNTVHIGRDMCAGPFILEKSSAYTVTFALLDASGNTTAWAQPPIRFTSPEPQSKALAEPELRLPGE